MRTAETRKTVVSAASSIVATVQLAPRAGAPRWSASCRSAWHQERGSTATRARRSEQGKLPAHLKNAQALAEGTRFGYEDDEPAAVLRAAVLEGTRAMQRKRKTVQLP